MPDTADALLTLIALSPSAIFLYFYLNRSRIPRKPLNTIVSIETENINREKTNPVAFYNRGLAYLKLGKYKKAVDDTTEALKIDPDYAAAYNVRGNAYAELRLYNEAVRDYSSAIRLEPQDWVAYYNRARIYHHFLSEHKLALSDALRAIELAPSDPGGYLTAGYVFRRQEKYADALKYLEKYADLEGAKTPPGVLNTIMYIKSKLEKLYL